MSRNLGAVPGQAAVCNPQDSKYQQFATQKAPLVTFFDTMTIKRGDLTVAQTITDSRTASKLAPGTELYYDAARKELHLPFFAYGLADSSDAKVRSSRDTNLWGGRYGAFHDPTHVYGITHSTQRGPGRSYLEITHIAVDAFNQDGTSILDTDLIDIQKAYVVQVFEQYGNPLANSPIELGNVFDYPGLYRYGLGAGDGDAHTTSNGAASLAVRANPGGGVLPVKGLIDLADVSNGDKPTRAYFKLIIPMDNKTAVQNDGAGDIFVAEGFSLLADNQGGIDALAAGRQPNISIQLTAWADRDATLESPVMQDRR